MDRKLIKKDDTFILGNYRFYKLLMPQTQSNFNNDDVEDQTE